MHKSICPICSAMTLQTAEGVHVCSSCETSVRSLKHVTIIQPRPLVRA